MENTLGWTEGSDLQGNLNNKFNDTSEASEPSDHPLCHQATSDTREGGSEKVGGPDSSHFVPICVNEAVHHFKNRQYPTTAVNGQSERRTFDLLGWLKPSPRLNDNLSSQLELVHSIMHCGLDWEDVTQWRMLQTIYMFFTQTDQPCPNRGAHWQAIGFQGNDPTTDLRRVGLFGVVQLLHLTSPPLARFGRLLFSVANSPVQPFPLAVLSLNATNITFNAIDSGKLVRECNARNSLLEVLNMYYVAVLVFILRIWIAEKKTIKDSGYLLKDAERYCSRNVKKVLKELPVELEKLLSP